MTKPKLNWMPNDRWARDGLTFSRRERVVSPYRERGLSDPAVQQFVEGDKPVLFMQDWAVDHFALAALYPFPVICWSRLWGDDMLAERCYFKDGAERRAMRVYKLYAIIGVSRRASFHREMGRIMAYPPVEVEEFVRSGLKSGGYSDD